MGRFKLIYHWGSCPVHHGSSPFQEDIHISNLKECIPLTDVNREQVSWEITSTPISCLSGGTLRESFIKHHFKDFFETLILMCRKYSVTDLTCVCVKLKQCLRESDRRKKCLFRSPRHRAVLPRSTLWYCAIKTAASLSDLALTSSNLKRIFPDPYCVNSIVFACLSLLKGISFCISIVSSSWEKWLVKYTCSEKSEGYIFPCPRKRDHFVLVDCCLDHSLHGRARLSHRHPSGETLYLVYGIISPEQVLWCSPALPSWESQNSVSLCNSPRENYGRGGQCKRRSMGSVGIGIKVVNSSLQSLQS